MLKKNPFKLFWFFFTKFKKCAKNRQKISLNILGLICRIEREKKDPALLVVANYGVLFTKWQKAEWILVEVEKG